MVVNWYICICMYTFSVSFFNKCDSSEHNDKGKTCHFDCTTRTSTLTTVYIIESILAICMSYDSTPIFYRLQQNLILGQGHRNIGFFSSLLLLPFIHYRCSLCLTQTQTQTISFSYTHTKPSANESKQNIVWKNYIGILEYLIWSYVVCWRFSLSFELVQTRTYRPNGRFNNKFSDLKRAYIET